MHCGDCLGSLEAVLYQDRVDGDDLNTVKLVLQDKDEEELFNEVIELTNKLTADCLDHLDDSDGNLNTSEIKDNFSNITIAPPRSEFQAKLSTQTNGASTW